MFSNQTVSKSTKQVTERLKSASRPFRTIWPRTPDAILGMFAVLIVGFAVLSNFTPVVKWASTAVSGGEMIAGIDGLLNPFRNPNLLLSEDLPVYDIEINHQEMAIIDEAIAEAVKQGWMSDDMKAWANATFFYEGVPYNVDIRVRGDLPNHWQGAKKSWRIKFGRSDIEHNGVVSREKIYFQGKRQINLIIPDDRDYILAPFVNELMREAGLVVPRDQFVVLRINGVVQGLYYEVEHFDKPLLAAYQRPETTVFAQNDRALHFEQYTKYGTPVASDAKYDTGVRRLQIETEGEISMQAMQAMQTLLDHSNNPTVENFERARAVLDWEKYINFRNITTLLNTNHVRFGGDNFKLYFDPSTGLLEPIPWDAHVVRMPREPGTIDYWNHHGTDELQLFTLLDPELRLERNKMLWEWIKDGGDELIAKYDRWHDKIRPLAWADVLSTPTAGHKMDELRSDFVFNVRRAHKVMSLSSGGLNFRLKSNQQAVMDVVSLNFSGIRLESISLTDPYFNGAYQLIEDVNENGELDERDILVAEATAVDGNIQFNFDKIIYPELRYDSDDIDGRHWEYFDTLTGETRYFLSGNLASPDRHPLEWLPPDIQVTSYNAVSEAAIPSYFINHSEALPVDSFGITAYDDSDVFDLKAPELSREEFLAAHPRFSASQTVPGAVELSGDLIIDSTVIVPKTVLLNILPGADITMMPKTSILSYGGLTAVGTADQQIKIHGDSSGKAWGTIAVVRAPQEVVLEYVDIRDGGQDQINAILFSGGVAVYNTDLRIEHSTIADMASEDGLNLKNGRIFMNDVLITRNASDGVDVDFGTGEVRNTHFIDNVNDGLDTSGSELLVIHNRFEGNGDKGFSVGEESAPIVVDNLFHANQIGISIKDLSHARVAYATFAENVLAIEAKRKKEFFGGGSGEIVNSVFVGNQTMFEDDYFSAGQVSITDSLADDQITCPACLIGIAQFSALERGDYRLEMDGAFTFSNSDWIVFEGADHPSRPGIFTELTR